MRGLRHNHAIELARRAGLDVSELKGPGRYGIPTSRSTLIPGRSFGSPGERERAEELYWLQAGGAIAELDFHVQVEILPGLSWNVDYRYVEETQLWHEDFKSDATKTQAFRLQKAAWKLNGPTPLRISERLGKGRGTPLVITEEVYPAGLLSAYAAYYDRIGEYDKAIELARSMMR